MSTLLTLSPNAELFLFPHVPIILLPAYRLLSSPLSLTLIFLLLCPQYSADRDLSDCQASLYIPGLC